MQTYPQINYINCINSNGEHYRMYYSAWGNPDTATKHMLCIHGLNRNSRDWDYVGAYAASLGYYVVCPDIVGRGLSANLINYMGYNIPAYIADTLNLIHTLGLKNIDFIGTSMGGIIGMGIAALPNNPFRSLVLNDIGGEIELAGLSRIMGYSNEQPYFDTLSDAKVSLINTSKEFGDLPDHIWQAMAQNSYQKNATGKYEAKRDPNIAKTLALLFQINDVFKPDINITDLNNLTTNINLSMNYGTTNFKINASVNPNMIAQNIMMWPVWNQISNLPTLIIRGERSDLLSVATVNKMLENRKDVTSVTIANAGHAPFLYSVDHMQILTNFYNNLHSA